MKLLNLLILAFIPLDVNSVYFTFHSYLTKNEYKTIYDSEKFVGLKLSSYRRVSNIKVVVSLYAGYFLSSYLYYLETSNQYNTNNRINFNDKIYYSSSSTSNTYYFNLPNIYKTNLYIGIPSFSGSYVRIKVDYDYDYDSNDYYHNYSGSGDLTSIAAIVIVFGILAFVLIIIVVRTIMKDCKERCHKGGDMMVSLKSSSTADGNLQEIQQYQTLDQYPQTGELNHPVVQPIQQYPTAEQYPQVVENNQQIGQQNQQGVNLNAPHQYPQINYQYPQVINPNIPQYQQGNLQYPQVADSNIPNYQYPQVINQDPQNNVNNIPMADQNEQLDSPNPNIVNEQDKLPSEQQQV